MEQGDLVGRSEERALLAALLARRDSAVIAGSSGVGKTRLARQALSDARVAGMTTAWVTATQSSRAIPFGALSPLLTGDALATGTALSPASVLQALGVGSGAATALPDVIAIDDAHLLDDASATLVLQLVTTGDAGVLFTMTSRTEAPDAITALWKDGAAQRVELQPLSRAESDTLVAELLGGPCDPLTLERVWDTTLGNALYLHELLDAARDGGRLTKHRGHWQLDTGGELARPLVGLVAARIDRLDPARRRVLDVVALAAPVPLRVLEAVVDLDAVADAEEGGLVEVIADRERIIVSAAHPMYAEVARSVLPGARRRAVCRELADALEATGLRRHDDLLRYLTWRLDAGENAPVEMLLRGAWQSTEALDNRLAERLGRAALAGSPHNNAARLALADAIYRQARHRDSLDVLAGSEATGDRERTEVIVARAKATWGLGQLEAAEAILLDAAPGITDHDCRGWLQAFRATLRAALGYPLESIELARAVADDPSYGARTTMSALGSLALAFAFAGCSADSARAAQRGSDPALLAAAESRTLLSWVEPALWASAWLSGDLRAAHDLADPYRVAGLRANDPERVAGGSMGVGWAALMRGEVGLALERLDDAIALAPAHDRIGIKTIALIGASWAQSWLGDTAAAAAALDEAGAEAARGARWFDPCATVGRAWIAATDGDEREARNLFEQAADDAERRGLLPYALLALHGLARLDRAGAVSNRLTALARRVDGPLAPAVVAHANALAAGDPLLLRACCDQFERLEMWLLAAECAAGEARARDAQGDPSGAEEARTRCEALLLNCGDARPITLDRLRTSSPLTARERQVARLAATGCTTREIAEQLHVSVRTVDSHLAHVYTKLGIDGRHELAAAEWSRPQ